VTGRLNPEENENPDDYAFIFASEGQQALAEIVPGLSPDAVGTAGKHAPRVIGTVTGTR
jgi:hypothetical protein